VLAGLFASWVSFVLIANAHPTESDENWVEAYIVEPSPWWLWLLALIGFVTLVALVAWLIVWACRRLDRE
jgi:hypothetical protein